MTNTQDFHIILLRHGESVANANGLLQGQSDWPLTENGVNQAKTLALQWETTLKSIQYAWAFMGNA